MRSYLNVSQREQLTHVFGWCCFACQFNVLAVFGDRVTVRLLLYSENTHALVASTWSQADGTYRFECIDPQQRYTVISTDYRQLYRAVIADNLRPELMP